MSKESKRTAFHAGDFISEDAVRGILGRRRRTASPTPTGAADGHAAITTAAAREPSRRTARGAPLRRWSVAELIARAAGPSPADGTSRG